MQREIQVGSQRFVVDDPNQLLMPLMEYDQVAKHDDPDVVEGTRDIERQSSIEPMPRNCDPIGANCIWVRGSGWRSAARPHRGCARDVVLPGALGTGLDPRIALAAQVVKLRLIST